MGRRVFVGVGVCVRDGVCVAGRVSVAVAGAPDAANRGVEQPGRHKMQIMMNTNFVTLFKTPRLGVKVTLFLRISPQKALHPYSKQTADNTRAAYEQA